MARSRSNSQSSSSSSGSSSSSSSGSSSSDSATPLSQARPKQAKAPAPIRLGEIPEGYHPTHFPKSNFDHSKVSSQQEIWVMKVPTGVSASSLNGVVLNLPNSKSSSSSSASMPIATFKAPTTFASSLSSEAEFHLHLTQPDSRSEAQAGTAGAETQLITMAGGAKAAEDAEKAQKRANGGAGLISGGGRELHGVNVFLSSGEGRGKMARIDESAIRRAHLVLAPPSNSTVRAITADSGEGPQAESAATQAAEAQGLETGHKRKREQPWNRMSGFFHPSGSITKDSPASLPNPKTEVEASASGSQPPEKKLKKDEKSSTENKEKKDKKDKKDKKEKKAKKSKKDK